jgi:integrase
LPKGVTVENGYREFLKWVEESSSYAVSYQSDLQKTVSRWATKQNLWTRRIDTLTEGDISSWLNSPECKLGYKRKQLSRWHLVSFFKYCMSKRIIDFNPVELVRIDHRSMPQKKLEGNPKPFWTEEELDTVTERATPEWKLVITLARDTGMRLGDIASLEWDNWDREANFIWRWTIKRNRRVKFAATERVASMLAAWPKTEGSPYVFPEFAALYKYSLKDVGTGTTPHLRLSVEFHRLAVETKVYRPGLSFHRIRATHARNLRKTHDLDAVRERLGHSNAYVTAGYTGEEYASERRKGT